MNLLAVFKLLLPALFPSWRFFDVIGPSPRVEFRLLENADDERDDWRECRPRPAARGPLAMLKSFFWNAPWNETLHFANCAERFIQGQTEHCSRELRRRIRADLVRDNGIDGLPPFFCFRLVFVSRFEGGLRRDVAFVSPLYPVTDPMDR